MEKIISACDRWGKVMYGTPGAVEGIEVLVGAGYNAAGILTDEAGDYKDGTGWYRGSVTKTVDIELDEKTDETN